MRFLHYRRYVLNLLSFKVIFLVPKVCLNEPMTIPGLQIVDDFIDESYEKNILSFLSENQERFSKFSFF